jgi:hypothetical protein
MIRRAILILALVSWSFAAAHGKGKAPQGAQAAQKGALVKHSGEQLGQQSLETAEAITADIQEDKWRLSWHERVIMMGRLAEMWWKADRTRARTWLSEALAQIEYEPQNEEPEHRRQRLEAGGVLLEIMSPLEQDHARRLAALLVRIANSIPEHERGRELRHRAGSSILEALRASETLNGSGTLDAERAAEFIRKLIALKDGNAFQPAYAGLRGQDPTLANQIFGEAMNAAREDYPYDLMYALLAIAFPSEERRADQLPSEQLRQQALAVLAEAILRVPETQQQQRSICRYAGNVSQLLSQFPTEQQGVLRQAIDGCTSARFRQAEGVRTAPRELTTSEDFLRAAQEETNLRQRVAYKQGAVLELQKTDPLRALDLLDEMPEQERVTMETWDLERVNTAGIAADRLYRQHDVVGFERVIVRTPSRLRPALLVRLASFLDRKAQQVLAIQLLTEARREMESTQVEYPHFFIEIVNAFAKLIPSEAPEVFREAMLGLNHVPSSDPEPEWPHLPLSYQLRPVDFTAQVSNLDVAYLSAAVSLLDSPADRVTIRLSLLGPVLRRYVDLQRSARPQKRQSAKNQF